MINALKGALLCIYLSRKAYTYKEKYLVDTDENKSEEIMPKAMKISVALVHDIFDIMGEDQTRAKYKCLG